MIAPRRARMRTALAAIAVLALLAVPAVALASSLKVVGTFPKSNPIGDKKPWPFTLKVTDGKKKMSGYVHYVFYAYGEPVPAPGEPPGDPQPGHKFKGDIYKDALKFPAEADGIALTVHFVVKTPYGTKTIEHTVTPKAP